MSQAEVSRFVSRALDDAALRQLLERNSESAFKGFDLNGDERSAIQTGDEHALREHGIDPMTARSWAAFHDVGAFAPDMPNAPGDLRGEQRS